MNKDMYPVFCMCQLAGVFGIIDPTIEYDTQWNEAKELYKEFENSKFDDNNEAEYDCMEKFLKWKKTQLAGEAKDFNLSVVLVQENRYDVRINATSKEEAEEILKNYFKEEGYILYPEGKDLHGVVCYDAERDWASIGSKEQIREIMRFNFKE